MHPASLAGELRASRQHLTRITADLDGERLLGPKLAIVNPPLWELGHVAWFQEYWCLRRKAQDEFAASIIPGADALYDSAKVAHDTRWSLPLPDLKATRSYQAEILERVIRRWNWSPGTATWITSRDWPSITRTCMPRHSITRGKPWATAIPWRPAAA